MRDSLIALLLLCFSASLFADDLERDAETIQILKEAPLKQSDLIFPKEASELGSFSNYYNAIFKPEGVGPFPAVVLSHSCGGLRVGEAKPWVQEGLRQGFVVLVIDSMRGYKNNCFPPNPINLSRRLKDMLDALEHLRSMSSVDSERIGAIGYSQGSMIDALLASPSAVQAVKPGSKRFSATVGLYGACQWPKGTYKTNPERSMSYIMNDTDRPLLYLIGGKDKETPASTCETLLPELKNKGLPVEWYLYENATHCWDCSSLNGFSKIDFRGEQILYKYDKDVTEDSIKRAFEFLKKY